MNFLLFLNLYSTNNFCILREDGDRYCPLTYVHTIILKKNQPFDINFEFLSVNLYTDNDANTTIRISNTNLTDFYLSGPNPFVEFIESSNLTSYTFYNSSVTFDDKLQVSVHSLCEQNSTLFARSHFLEVLDNLSCSFVFLKQIEYVFASHITLLYDGETHETKEINYRIRIHITGSGSLKMSTFTFQNAKTNMDVIIDQYSQSFSFDNIQLIVQHKALIGIKSIYSNSKVNALITTNYCSSLDIEAINNTVLTLSEILPQALETSFSLIAENSTIYSNINFAPFSFLFRSGISHLYFLTNLSYIPFPISIESPLYIHFKEKSTAVTFVLVNMRKDGNFFPINYDDQNPIKIEVFSLSDRDFNLTGLNIETSGTLSLYSSHLSCQTLRVLETCSLSLCFDPNIEKWPLVTLNSYETLKTIDISLIGNINNSQGYLVKLIETKQPIFYNHFNFKIFGKFKDTILGNVIKDEAEKCLFFNFHISNTSYSGVFEVCLSHKTNFCSVNPDLQTVDSFQKIFDLMTPMTEKLIVHILGRHTESSPLSITYWPHDIVLINDADKNSPLYISPFDPLFLDYPIRTFTLDGISFYFEHNDYVPLQSIIQTMVLKNRGSLSNLTPDIKAAIKIKNLLTDFHSLNPSIIADHILVDVNDIESLDATFTDSKLDLNNKFQVSYDSTPLITINCKSVKTITFSVKQTMFPFCNVIFDFWDQEIVNAIIHSSFESSNNIQVTLQNTTYLNIESESSLIPFTFQYIPALVIISAFSPNQTTKEEVQFSKFEITKLIISNMVMVSYTNQYINGVIDQVIMLENSEFLFEKTYATYQGTLAINKLVYNNKCVAQNIIVKRSIEQNGGNEMKFINSDLHEASLYMKFPNITETSGSSIIPLSLSYEHYSSLATISIPNKIFLSFGVFSPVCRENEKIVILKTDSQSLSEYAATVISIEGSSNSDDFNYSFTSSGQAVYAECHMNEGAKTTEKTITIIAICIAAVSVIVMICVFVHFIIKKKRKSKKAISSMSATLL